MKKKNNKGFSLIELIIAIAILVILTGLLAPQFMRYLEKSREAKDMQALDTVYGSVQTALANEGAYKIAIDGTTYAELSTTGTPLSEIVGKTDAFATEVLATLGDATGNKLWSSKVVLGNKDEDANEKVFIFVNKETLKVTTWIGKAATAANGPVVEDALSPTSTTKTAGTTFFISK